MNTPTSLPTPVTPRRGFLRQLGLSAALLAAPRAFAEELATKPGAFAEALTRTPRQTEGPFYPDKLPLDTDNDLLIINNAITPAVGEVTWLNGRLLDASGEPIRNAVIEIWQCDATGVYLHSASSTGQAGRDKNFQGYGRFLTGSTGEYVFRTIKPVPYPGRTPHIHFKIKRGQQELLTTQCYIKGYAGNSNDGIWRELGEGKARDAVTVDFAPLKNSRAGELTAHFDLVLGVTPEA